VVNPIWTKIHRWTVRELRKVTFATLARRTKKLPKSRKPRQPCPVLP
jgi:hypothetical protein